MRQVTTFLAVLIALVAAPTARANGPWQRFFQDAKFPSQAMLEHYTWTTPILGGSTSVSAAAALTTSAATTVSTFTAQPDVPRNITITPNGVQIGAGTAVVTGTNTYGKSITENFTISSNQSTATTGSKAFKSVTSVAFPATTGAGGFIAIGVGTKLGLPRCVADAGDYAWSKFNAAFETTRGTLAVNASTVESNTFTPNGTMDGAKNVDLYYVENFRCYPN